MQKNTNENAKVR
jgi:hypothetical protein